MMTDKLIRDDAAYRTVMSTVEHRNHLYANTRAEVSHNRLVNKNILGAALLPQLKLNSF